MFPICCVAAQDNICDYYDQYGMFILTFNKDIKLGRSGPSITSGISFIFPEQATLSVVPGIATHDPNNPLSLPDDISFIKDYIKDGCTLSYSKTSRGTIITCDNYEYSIYETTTSPYKSYIKFFYDFKNKDSLIQYKDIMNSLLLMPIKFYDEFNNITKNALGHYYFSQDKEYQVKIDSYEQPDIACGQYRVRDELLKILTDAHE